MRSEKSPCCNPSRDQAAVEPSQVTKRSTRNYQSVEIEGGVALLGTDRPFIKDDGEAPLRRKKISPYKISPTAVTNEEFSEFIDDTGYKTDAEKYGWSFVFFSDVKNEIQEFASGAEWWRSVKGADWKNIHGPNTDRATWQPDHPVVHVSWNDATAYAKWVGGRLPTELEWEHAARGGLKDAKFPWGDVEPNDADQFLCNIWQGNFPNENTGIDGWLSTAPVKSFEPNRFGLYNLVGNVWEWTSENYRIKSLKKSVQERMKIMKGFKTLKGGSYLCHKSYCFRYRIAARTGNSPESTTSHQGFRVVWDC